MPSTRLSLLVCWLVALPASALAAPSAPALDFANTYAVIVGVLKWEDGGLTPYPTRNRKDQELYDTLRSRGVPAENMSLLLDEKATLASMRKSLQTIAEKAKPESTLIFYYAGHGWQTPAGGAAFANYDYSGKKKDKPAFHVREISDTLPNLFKGSRVLLFADCCHSGGLQDVAQRLANAKFQAAAITSADAICVSTNNWTFTQTIVDGFAGEPYVDADGDGTITLGELAGEVALAMQYRERQRCGHALEGLAPDFRLVPVERDRKLPSAIKGDFALKEFVGTRNGGTQRIGRIMGFKDDIYSIEFYNYSDKEVVALPASALSKIKYRIYKVGDVVTLGRAGSPKAKVLEVAGAFHRVTFPDQPARPQEWVLSDRIVDDPKSAAEVEWKGKWYPAIVLKTEGEKHHIHFVGYDDNWNEWVGKDRIRFAGKSRNPFGVEDVPDPTGEDVKAFAASMKLEGGEKDRNAEQWVKEATAGKAGELDGDWYGRWDSGAGTAKVKVVKDRVYVLYTDTEGGLKGKTWLLEAIRDDKGRLMGRWAQVGNPADAGMFAGVIVGDERIDGTWGGGARWDFRRKIRK